MRHLLQLSGLAILGLALFVGAGTSQDNKDDKTHNLANLLMDADGQQFAIIYPKFKETGEKGLLVLSSEIDRRLPPDAKDDDKEKLAKRQANAAVALLKMGQPEKVWPLLNHRPDPRVRSYLIHRFGPLGADAKVIVKRLDEEPDVTIRRALILSLGEYGEKDFLPDDRKALVPKLQEMYRTATDPGLHASSEWLLRTWQQEAWLNQVNEEWAKDKKQREKRLDGIGKALAKDKEKTPPQWYVNGQGETMVVVPKPGEFWMGEGNEKHRRKIDRSFAIGSKEVTVEQFLRFRKEHPYHKQLAPTSDCPVNGVSWYDAAAYCNWLSGQEGIPKEQWCYVANKDGKYAEGMTMAPNYLQRTGYRLPTEAEWEYACRAGADTEYSFGTSADLLDKYGWFDKNSLSTSHPVGLLKSNDLGLFDMHGNVWQWCQNIYKAYPKGEGGNAYEDDEDDIGIITDQKSRVLRGGSFALRASFVRSAYRANNAPADRSYSYGFRPARTLPLGSFTALALPPKGAKNEK
jgi:eukaryotic-like serine/threonine-protein kinase